MTRKNILITGSVSAFVIIAIVVFWVFRPASKTVKSKKADVEITAENLIQAYEADEAEANKLYNDKVILVTGTIAGITDDAAVITVTLKNPESISGVLCSFDKNTISKEVFTVGDEVKIKGICNGYLMDVVLNKCFLQE